MCKKDEEEVGIEMYRCARVRGQLTPYLTGLEGGLSHVRSLVDESDLWWFLQEATNRFNKLLKEGFLHNPPEEQKPLI